MEIHTVSNNFVTHTLTNAAGCDSIVTLDLTINYSTFGTDVITVTATPGLMGIPTRVSATIPATYVLSNVAGCDSTISLNLTINNQSTN